MTGTMVGCTVRARRDIPTELLGPGVAVAGGTIREVVAEWWQNGEGWYELQTRDAERMALLSPDVFWEEVQRCSWCHGRRTLDAATGESAECGVCDRGWVVVESPS